MAKKRASLFAGGGGSAAEKLKKVEGGSPLQPAVDISEAALRERAEARKKLPEVSLVVSYSQVTSTGKVITIARDFSDLSRNYPHHEELIRQLVVGADLVLPPGLNETCARHVYGSIKEFIHALNSERMLLNKKVRVIADIDLIVCKTFCTYLISVFPRRTDNRKYYGALRRMVHRLQDKYPDQFPIGRKFRWPPGPGNNETSEEGYFPHQMIELMEVCKKDIIAVQSFHRLYKELQPGEGLFCEEWNLENLMYYLHDAVTSSNKRTPREAVMKAHEFSKTFQAFLKRENLNIDRFTEILINDGSRLAEDGKAPLSLQYDKAVRAVIKLRKSGKKTVSPEQLAKTAGISVGTLYQNRPEWKELKSALEDETISLSGCGWNMNNAMFWFENLGYMHRPLRDIIRNRIDGSPVVKRCVANLGYSFEDLVALYQERGVELASKGCSPWGSVIVQKPDRVIAEVQFKKLLASLKYEFPMYPFYMEEQEARSFFSYDRYNALQPKMKSVKFDLVISAAHYGLGKITFFGGELGRDALFASKHFTIETLYPFFLMFSLVTGWNTSTVLEIADDLYSHLEDDLIDNENYLVICATKRRGNKRKWEKNEITHRSHRKRPFDAYMLLQYIHKVVSQYKKSQHYIQGQLWQYTVASSAGAKCLINCLSNTGFTDVTRKFVARHQLKGFKQGESIDHKRIRSGWTTLRQLLDRSPYELSDDLDHRGESAVETSMRHYASDGSSNAVMDIGIKHLQNQFIADFIDFEARVIQAKYLQELRDGIREARNEAERDAFLKRSAEECNIEEKTLVHILSPGAQKYIAVCKDVLNPSWPGCDQYINHGEPCRYFNKCCLCKQAVIFPEALPYVARRLLDLEKLQIELLPVEWSNIYGEEYDGWNSILECWNNSDQVEEAKHLAKIDAVVLPEVMRGV